MYFVPSLVTCDLVALKFSPPAGAATSACVSISHLGEAKRDFDAADQHVYYTCCHDTVFVNSIPHTDILFTPHISTISSPQLLDS